MSKKVSLAVLTLVLAVCLTGCSSQQKTADGRPMQEVKYTPTELKKAEIEKRIDSKYSDAGAHFDLGQLYRQDAMWGKAEIEYNITLQLEPGHKGAQAAMVKMYIERKNTVKSGILADIYKNQARASAEASLLLGKAFQSEGLDDYAFECLNNALMLAPNSAALHRQMGYHYKKKGDIVRAEEAFKRSFQLDPYNASVAGELGRMGVAVEIPRKLEKNTKKLDKILEKDKK